MEQRLTHIPVPKWNAAYAICPHGKNQHQERLVPSISPNLIQIQLVQVHINTSRRHEQHQLNHGMIHHMQHRSAHSQSVFLTQQTLHGTPRKNKANLGHGGACQGTF